MNDYSEMVITLHDIARSLEIRIGECQLSEQIRECANKLHQFGEPLKVKE